MPAARLLEIIDSSLKEYDPARHSHLGGQERFLELHKNYNEQLPLILPKKAQRTLQDVAFYFVHAWDLDAYSASEGPDALVAQNVGSVLLLFEIAYALLAHPKALLDVGSPESEKLCYTQLDRATDARVLGLPSEPNIASSPRYVPQDSTRRQFADLVAHLALDYMFLHEFGHIVAGHPGFKQEHLGGARHFHAFGTIAPVAPSVVLKYHAMEFDADWYAMRLLAVAVARRTAITADPYMVGFDTLELLRALALAAFLLFVLDPTPASFEVYCYERDHPHPYFRFLVLEHCVPDAFELNGLPLIDEWHGAFRQALKDTHFMSLVVGYGQEFFQDVVRFGPRMNERVTEVYEAHEELLRLLLKEERDLRGEEGEDAPTG